MMPEGRRYQAVTQVKALSPENLNISEADIVHKCGRQYGCRTATGEVSTALAGSKTMAWYQRIAWELGRPRMLSIDKMDYGVMSYEKR